MPHPVTARTEPPPSAYCAVVILNDPRHGGVGGDHEEHRRSPVLLPHLFAGEDDASRAGGLHRQERRWIAGEPLHHWIGLDGALIERARRRVRVQRLQRGERGVKRNERAGTRLGRKSRTSDADPCRYNLRLSGLSEARRRRLLRRGHVADKNTGEKSHSNPGAGEAHHDEPPATARQRPPGCPRSIPGSSSSSRWQELSVRTLKVEHPRPALPQGRLSEENYHRQCHGGSGLVESPQVLGMKELAGNPRTSPGPSASRLASRFFNTGQTFAPLQGD